MSTKSNAVSPHLAEPPPVNHFQLFTSTIGSSGDAVMISQRARGSNLMPSIITINQAFLEITGFREDEVLGAPATIVQDATRDMPGLKDVETVSFESEMFHRSGEFILVTWTVCKLTNANLETWIAVFHENSSAAAAKSVINRAQEGIHPGLKLPARRRAKTVVTNSIKL